MAERPVFIPVLTGFQLVRETMVAFQWHPGMAPSQKKKNVAALHEAAEGQGLGPVLEVSTKSDERLGVCLSAFNLKVEMTDGWLIPLESAFQGSKAFEHGGPYRDLYGKNGRDIKNDERLRTSGRLNLFSFDGLDWKLEPKTAFYDWLYVQAVHRQPELRERLREFAGFTDIEFNPQKSINCQARSCALYVSLLRRDIVEEVVRDRQMFLDCLGRDSFYQLHSIDKRQGTLFEMGEDGQRKSCSVRRKRRR